MARCFGTSEEQAFINGTGENQPTGILPVSYTHLAADAYWQLFKLWYKDEDNIGTLDMIRRAVCISAQTKQTTLYNEIQEWFKEFKMCIRDRYMILTKYR